MEKGSIYSITIDNNEYTLTDKDLQGIVEELNVNCRKHLNDELGKPNEQNEEEKELIKEVRTAFEDSAIQGHLTPGAEKVIKNYYEFNSNRGDDFLEYLKETEAKEEKEEKER